MGELDKMTLCGANSGSSITRVDSFPVWTEDKIYLCDDNYAAIVPNLGGIMMASMILGSILLMPLLDVYGRRTMNLILTSIQTIVFLALAICITIEKFKKLILVASCLLILAITSLPRIYTSLIYCCDITTASIHKYIYFFGFTSMFLTAGTLFYLT